MKVRTCQARATEISVFGMLVLRTLRASNTWGICLTSASSTKRSLSSLMTCLPKRTRVSGRPA